MMNQKISQQNWTEIRGEIQKSFSNLSADELEETHGDAALLTNLVEEREGIHRSEAEKRLDEIVARCGTRTTFEDGIDIDSDLDDERFGMDTGHSSAQFSPSGEASDEMREEERMARTDMENPDISYRASDKSQSYDTESDRRGRAESTPPEGVAGSPDRFGKGVRSSSEYASERRSPETNPNSGGKTFGGSGKPF